MVLSECLVEGSILPFIVVKYRWSCRFTQLFKQYAMKTRQSESIAPPFLILEFDGGEHCWHKVLDKMFTCNKSEWVKKKENTEMSHHPLAELDQLTF